MCGIAGMSLPDARAPVDEALLVRMRDTLVHRGPDEGGVHIEPGVGLAHRRLSIIDLSSGHQPLFNEDGSMVVYNGEIYNFPELVEELQGAGHCFRMRFDEPDYAAWVAGRYHTRHRTERVDAADFALVDRLVSLYDEPFADSGLFDRDYLIQLLDRHQSGRREHSAPLWSLLMFEGFLRMPPHPMGGAG